MISLAEISAMPYVFLLLAIVVIGWLLFRITRRINQKKTFRPTRRMMNTVRSLGTASPPELDRWSVEMQELARDTLAQIDTKMRALDYLITQATAAAQRLEAALTNENLASESQRYLGQSDPPAEDAALPHSSPQSLDTHKSLDTPESLNTHSQADVLERATGRTHHDDTSQDTAAANTESRQRLIYEMADRGVDLEAIASAVGSPMGEIELILGLRRQAT